MVVAEQYRQLAAASKFLRGVPLWVYVFPYLIHGLAAFALIKRGNGAPRMPPLPDVLADNMPYLSQFRSVVSWGVPVVLTLFMICALRSGRGDSRGFLLGFFRYTALLLLLRSITVHATLLPPCRSEHGTTTANACAFIVGHAYDKIFSGHTAVELLALLLAWRYGVLGGTWLALWLVLQAAAAFLMVPTGMHYTIDVILAYVVATSLFFLFDL